MPPLLTAVETYAHNRFGRYGLDESAIYSPCCLPIVTAMGYLFVVCFIRSDSQFLIGNHLL